MGLQNERALRAVLSEQFCLEKHLGVISDVSWRLSDVSVNCLYTLREI